MKSNTEFAESLSLTYPLLSDPSRKVSDVYGVTDAQRQVPRRWTFYIGEDGKILHIDKSVNARNHGADCAAKLAELGVAKAE